MEISTILLALFVFGVVVSVLLDGGMPKAYRARQCQGELWRRRFPEASKQSIREFLALFTSAFAFKEKHALKFAPQDELLAIYRALYPSRLMPDTLEFETLNDDLKAKYKISLGELWNDHLTLGELFSKVSAVQQGTPGDGYAAPELRR